MPRHKTAKIEDCPFCGSSDTQLENGSSERRDDLPYVICVDCLATGPMNGDAVPVRERRRLAIHRWNEVAVRVDPELNRVTPDPGAPP